MAGMAERLEVVPAVVPAFAARDDVIRVGGGGAAWAEGVEREEPLRAITPARAVGRTHASLYLQA